MVHHNPWSMKERNRKETWTLLSNYDEYKRTTKTIQSLHTTVQVAFKRPRSTYISNILSPSRIQMKKNQEATKG